MVCGKINGCIIVIKYTIDLFVLLAHFLYQIFVESGRPPEYAERDDELSPDSKLIDNLLVKVNIAISSSRHITAMRLL